MDHHTGEKRYDFGPLRDFQDRFNAYDNALSFTVPGLGPSALVKARVSVLPGCVYPKAEQSIEFRFGFNRLSTSVIQENVGQNRNEELGFPTISTDPRFFGFPQVNVSGFDSIGEVGNTPPGVGSQHLSVRRQADLASSVFNMGVIS